MGCRRIPSVFAADARFGVKVIKHRNELRFRRRPVHHTAMVAAWSLEFDMLKITVKWGAFRLNIDATAVIVVIVLAALVPDLAELVALVRSAGR